MPASKRLEEQRQQELRYSSERRRLKKMIWIRACYRLFYNHPLLFFILLFLIYLRISFPYVFFLFISASPVIICTAFLLVALISLGQKHSQGTENDALKGHKLSSTSHGDSATTRQKGDDSSGGGGGGGGSFRDKFAEVRKDIVEKEMKESRFMENDNKFPKAEFKKHLNGDAMVEEIKAQSKDIMGGRKNGGQVRTVRFMEPVKEKEVDMDHSSSLSPSTASSISEEDCDVAPPSYHPLHDESPMAMKLNEVKDDDEVSTIVREELEEILEASSSDNEHKQQLEELIEARSRNYDSDVNDEEEEGENKEIDEDDDEDDETGKGIKSMVNWTEEDEKNLNDLSRLELERNQQLEKIIAKRKARKTLSTITENSLMDLDRPFHVTPILTAKTNPFDVASPASHPSETYPIPGSAPAFLPRRNPFDDIEDSHENKPSFGTPRHNSSNRSKQDGDESNSKEALFRRYRSFGVVGSSFYGFLWQENEESTYPFKPYFNPEEGDVPENVNAQDSVEHESTSSSSEDVMKDQEEEHEGELVASASAGIEHRRKEVEDTAAVEPKYDSYETSPTDGEKNIFSRSDLSEMEDDKPDGM